MSRLTVALIIVAVVISSAIGGGATAWMLDSTRSSAEPHTAPTNGRDGVDGRDGAAGRDGADGAPGPRGLAGAPGRDGAVGAAGAPGTPGPQGATGPQGAVGDTGPAGSDGATGAAGADALLSLLRVDLISTSQSDTSSGAGPTISGTWAVVNATAVGIDTADYVFEGDSPWSTTISVAEAGWYRVTMSTSCTITGPYLFTLRLDLTQAATTSTVIPDVCASRSGSQSYSTVTSIDAGGALGLRTSYAETGAGDWSISMASTLTIERLR